MVSIAISKFLHFPSFFTSQTPAMLTVRNIKLNHSNLFIRHASKDVNVRNKKNQYDIKDQNSNDTVSVSTDSNVFIPVYWFERVPLLGLGCKLIKYPIAFTVLGTPISYALFLNDFCPLETYHAVLGIGGSMSISFAVLNFILYRTVGAIYVKEDGKEVKISYIDFNGNRADDIIPKTDLMLISDLPTYPSDRLFLLLRRKSCKGHYKFNPMFGKILDKKLLEYALGRLSFNK